MPTPEYASQQLQGSNTPLSLHMMRNIANKAPGTLHVHLPSST
jgi:hypothetical protein